MTDNLHHVAESKRMISMVIKHECRLGQHQHQYHEDVNPNQIKNPFLHICIFFLRFTFTPFNPTPAVFLQNTAQDTKLQGIPQRAR